MQTFSNSNDKTPPIHKFKYFMIIFGSFKEFSTFSCQDFKFKILANHCGGG
jgi:hypothetical protein